MNILILKKNWKIMVSILKGNTFTCTKLHVNNKIIYSEFKTIIDINKIMNKYNEDHILPNEPDVLIDLLVESSHIAPKPEKKKLLKAAQYIANQYEKYIGRPVFKTIL